MFATRKRGTAMDDFLHQLIVVATFFIAALIVKLALSGLALVGSAEISQALSSALQLTLGLAAAFGAHHRARRPRTAASLARSGP
jgi:hypothetical protein